MIDQDRAAVRHWYDFICPFCYVAQSRNAALRAAGASIFEQPFEAHPDIPEGGIEVGPRHGATYVFLKREAEAAGLALRWPHRLPNARVALAIGGWIGLRAPSSSAVFNARVFAAHFANSEDIGDIALLERFARDAEVDLDALRGAMLDGSAARLLRESEDEARRVGVQGTPAWLIGGALVSGLRPEAELQSMLGSR